MKRRGAFFASFSNTKCPSRETRANPREPATSSRGVTLEKSRIVPGLTSFVQGNTTHLSPASTFMGGGGRPKSTLPAGLLSESAKVPATSNSIVEDDALFAFGNSIRTSKRSALSLRASCTATLPAVTASRSLRSPFFETTSIDDLSLMPIHSFPNFSGSATPFTLPPAK